MMHLKEVVRIVHGEMLLPEGGLAGELPAVAAGVSTDTRTLRPGDLYFALKGPHFDGHDYVAEAFRKGAVAAVVRRPVPATGPLIRVESVLTALGNLAAVYRMMLGCRVIAVTGSNGKTTTKEMIAHILGATRKVTRAKDSWNNFIGVPLTLFEAKPETEFIVLEVGTNHRGEIARLGAIARPDAAVITSVSEAHLEGLGSLSGVAEEKASLFLSLRGSGFGVFPADATVLDPFLPLPKDKRVTIGTSEGADLRAEDVVRTVDGLVFRVRGVTFRIGLLGEWNVTNALAASAVALSFGVSLPECAERLRTFRGPKMRMEPLYVAGISILNDAYNSNPASALRAIEEFSRSSANGRRVVVFGDMLELGGASAHWHEEIGHALARTEGIDLVVGVGTESRRTVEIAGGVHFADVREAGAAVREFLRVGDSVLLKGSRGMKLEHLIKSVSESFDSPLTPVGSHAAVSGQ